MARPKIKLIIETALRREVERRFRETREVRQRERFQAVLLACGGQHTLQEIAEVIGRARSTVQRYLERFGTGDVEALLRCEKPKGKPSELGRPEILEDLRAGLAKGQWRTASQIAAWLKEKHNITRASQTMYYWLGKLAGALRVPRPVHTKRDPQQVAAFREHLLENLRALQIPKGQPVRVWVADECRQGLHTIVRRCWAQRGKRVVVPRQLKYEWGYTYGALDCVSGAAEFLHTNGVSLEASQCFLEQLAASDGEAQHVVIWDQAGFHQRPSDPQLPQNVHLLPLPPYSPELNPIEQLWDITKDVICNQVFATMDALNEKLNEALRPYWEDAKRVLSLIGDRYLTVPVNAS